MGFAISKLQKPNLILRVNLLPTQRTNGANYCHLINSDWSRVIIVTDQETLSRLKNEAHHMVIQ